mgnify:CR=1 FL=1
MASLSHSDQVRAVYRNQLKKFYQLGIGNKTEFGVVVTDRLIDITQRRLNELDKSSGVRAYGRRAA